VNTLKVGRRQESFVRPTQREVRSTEIYIDVVETLSAKCEIQ
jgi:hypothetical protein